MNERLTELAHQADLVIKKRNGDDFRFGGMDPKLEKFAELIVHECIDEFISQLWNYGIDESNNPSFYKAVDRVKQSFGVE